MICESLASRFCYHESAVFEIDINRYQILNFLSSFGEAEPATVLFDEFLLMLLYVDLDDVQRFAGKHGEAEARRAYAQLEIWCLEEQSRNAAYHAGQVLRAGQSVPKYGLRGFESIALYQATLVLWVYGVLKCATVPTRPGERQLGAGSVNLMSVSTNEMNQAEGERRVYLNGPMTGDLKRFVELGQGSPGLRRQQSSDDTDEDQFYDLRKSQMVMAVGVSVLEGNCSHTSGAQKVLPPLPARLRDLMQELGSLPEVPVV